MTHVNQQLHSVTDLLNFLHSVETGETQVNRMSPATARQYKSVWRKLSEGLTDAQKIDISNIPSSNFQDILILVAKAFNNVTLGTQHSYAKGVQRCIELVESPVQTTDAFVGSIAQTSQTEDFTPQDTSHQYENRRLRKEIEQLRQENQRLKRALSSLVADG